MAAINGKVVRRSNALASLVYGADFSHDESMLVENRGSGLLLSGSMSLGMIALAIGPLRRLISKRLPQPGDGPSLQSVRMAFSNSSHTRIIQLIARKTCVCVKESAIRAWSNVENVGSSRAFSL